MRSRAPAAPVLASTTTLPRARRWLLFVHQLPSNPSNLRVSTWRRLQQLGAVSLKQAVYVLPDTPSAREDFEWLKTEVNAAGGDATVFAADHVDAWSDDALVEAFRRSRQDAYAALARDAEHALKRANRVRRPQGTRAPAVRRLLDIFRERLAAIEGMDFFGSAGRDRAIAVLEQLEGRCSDVNRARAVSALPASRDVAAYRGRRWVTRPRPGVDRMASAWLIRRFIDPQARFSFAAERQMVPEHGVPFDMVGVDFSHEGDGCTFDTLCSVFALAEPALSRIAGIVRDLDFPSAADARLPAAADVNAERFGAPESATLGAMIEGLQLAYPEDDALLAQGMTVFESLYRSFEQSMRPAGPRPLARPTKKTKKRRDHD